MKRIINISILLFIFNFLGTIIVFLIERTINFPDDIVLGIIHKLIIYTLDIPIIYYFIKNNKQREYFMKKEKLSIKNFISCIALMLFIAKIVTILFFLLELRIGNDSNEILFSYPTSHAIIIFINLFSRIIMAPIVEEIIFRGVIMNDLREYGYKSAIIINSILFGLSHVEIRKIIITILFGIIFSYIAYRYSLKYSILLHMVWNLCFGLGNNILNFNEMIIDIIRVFIPILSIILFIVFIIGMVKRKYSVLFSIFKFDIDDKNNMILFFKNNTVFILIILIIFFINCYIFYL